MADRAQPQGCSFRASVPGETIASASGNAIETESERWLPVVGFEGWYEVSSLGRVRRIRKPAGAPTCRLLKASPDTWGYLSVRPSAPGKPQRTLRVHLLVADAFIGPRADGFEVDHRDGVKAHCELSNLEVVTHSVNMKRAYALGLNPGHGLRRRWPHPVDSRALAAAILDRAEATS